MAVGVLEVHSCISCSQSYLLGPNDPPPEDYFCQIAEEERAGGRPAFLSVMYNELVRRHVEKRAQKKHPNLDKTDTFARTDKSLLTLATQCLEPALR